MLEGLLKVWLAGGYRKTTSHLPADARLRWTVKMGLVLRGLSFVRQLAREDAPEPPDGTAAVLPDLHIVPVRTTTAAEPRTFVLPMARR